MAAQRRDADDPRRPFAVATGCEPKRVVLQGFLAGCHGVEVCLVHLWFPAELLRYGCHKLEPPGFRNVTIVFPLRATSLIAAAVVLAARATR